MLRINKFSNGLSSARYHKSAINRLCMVLLALVFILPGVATISDQSHALSRKCERLNAELASLNNGNSRPSKKFKQYDRAVRDQQVQISKTIRAAQKQRCQYRKLAGVCKRINSSLKKMKANLASLKRTRSKYASSGSNRRRATIKRDLVRNRCNQPAQANNASKKPKRRSLLEQIFGVKTYSNDGKREIPDYEGDQTIRRSYKTYRTLCVRTCDGYYFPVSFSTTKDRMENDLQQCEKLCPGTETALFYHKMPSQDAEQSISYRTGEPYASLENAFSYRKKVNLECSCKYTSGTMEEIAGGVKPLKPVTDPYAADTHIQRIALPIYRQDINLDPDSLDNQFGKLTLERLEILTSKERDYTSAQTEDGRKIRIVGPAFFPVQ